MLDRGGAVCVYLWSNRVRFVCHTTAHSVDIRNNISLHITESILFVLHGPKTDEEQYVQREEGDMGRKLNQLVVKSAPVSLYSIKLFIQSIIV